MSGYVKTGIALGAAISVSLCAVVANAEVTQLSWGYNSFGVPGMVDMPVAFSRQDAELSTAISHAKNQTRISETFQLAPRLSATYRYSLLYQIRPSPDSTSVLDHLFDRSLSLHYRFLDETPRRPAMAIGLNDIMGTGVYAGEYVVASKTITPRVRGTLGLGWGRLGSSGGFRNPLAALNDSFEDRPPIDNPQGGKFNAKTWFHGPAALFGGVEWQATNRLRFIAEYSSDAYRREDGASFDRRSAINLALAYRLTDATTLTASYLYGSEIGLQFSHSINPRFPPNGSGVEPAPPPVVPRPGGAHPAGSSVSHPDRMSSDTAAALKAQGLELDGLALEGRTLHIEIRNRRYGNSAQALGRAARVLTRTAPPDIDAFAITLSAKGMPVTTATIPRDDLATLEFDPVAPDLLRADTRIEDSTSRVRPMAGRYPLVRSSLAPDLRLSLFDPDNPLRADLGALAGASIEPRPGLSFAGHLYKKVIGNLDQSTRASNSVLPHVRSDTPLYAKTNGVTIPDLTVAYYFRPGRNLFGRVTGGLLEPMFGGVSAEVMWKPQNSRLALGAEVNRVAQRDYDQLFGFLNYRATTAHLTAHYDLGRGYHVGLSAGRYLAGDKGATLEFDRQFDNGWRVGAFATKTNVSAADFGEGSFDKGIRLTIPLDWVSGRSSRTRLDMIVRPLTRDGGATLNVPGRLYELVRDKQASSLDPTWGRFWR